MDPKNMTAAQQKQYVDDKINTFAQFTREIVKEIGGHAYMQLLAGHVAMTLSTAPKPWAVLASFIADVRLFLKDAVGEKK